MKPKKLTLEEHLTAAANAKDAHQYRLWQAGKLLASAGYVEQPDGSWRKPEEPQPSP
jgi:hypothetical protein